MNTKRLSAFQYWPHLITLIIIGLAFGGYRFFAYHYTRSDDSYVSANVINIASLVAGPISRIYVYENQVVKRGEKLIEVDSRPYLYAMQKAAADLTFAKIKYKNNKNGVIFAEQQLKQIQSQLELSHDHLRRYQALQQKGDIAVIQVVDVESRIKEQEAKVAAAVQQLQIAEQNFDDSEVKAAIAIYNRARYLYEHTMVVAPTDGYITNFNLRQGQYIRIGEWLFALVDTSQWWVETRYRETVIRLIKPGDKAKIYLDMYPGKVFYGHVVSIGWGINRVQSGEVAPSSLAYLEATEDWIRISQRFPVRIYFDKVSPAFPLRIGANATTITYR